jgi:AraC-like DNA-binding protein
MDYRIAQVIGAMEADLDNRQSIAALAAGVNLSPARLAVLFRQETGVTPVRYLRALRMERARVLLERTFLTVKEVMAFVGVSDPSHFTRDFRRYHGVPPTHLRQRSWAADGRQPHTIGQGIREIAHERPAPLRRAPAIVGENAGDSRAQAQSTTTPTPDGRPVDGQGENS